MENYFDCAVKYRKIDEKTGKEKKVTEHYLVDAVSFTEAEERIYREMEHVISGEFSVKDIKHCNYSDIFIGHGRYLYKAKIFFSSIDETSGSEKKIANYVLASGDSVEYATDNIKQSLLSNLISSFDIISVSKSKIVDYFKYR